MDIRSVEAVDGMTAWATAFSIGFSPSYQYPKPPYTIPLPSLPILMRTTDGGAKWEASQYGTYNEGFNDVSSPDGTTAVAVGTDIIYSSIPVWVYVFDYTMYLGLEEICRYNSLLTSDGGSSWTNVQVDLGSNPLPDSVDMADRGTGWIVGSGGGVARTIDGGSHWSLQGFPAGNIPLKDVRAVNPAVAWAGGNDGVVLRTIRGGDDSPDLLSVNPSSGKAGAEVELRGCDFGSSRGSSKVTFGGVEAQEYLYWSNGVVRVRVPSGLPVGKVEVRVYTENGVSNVQSFNIQTESSAPSVNTVSPTQASQLQASIELRELRIEGSGFQQGASVRLMKGDKVIAGYNVTVPSPNVITCTFGFLGAEPGTYDLVVTNPDGSTTLLKSCFTVTAACGTGTASMLPMFGIFVGVPPIRRLLRRRRRRIP